MAQEPTELENRLALRVISLQDQLEAAKRENDMHKMHARFVRASPLWPALYEEIYGETLENG